jgi:hypothetical protein
MAQPAQEEPAMGLSMEAILSIAVGTILYLIYGIGAYRLSYNTNGSVFLGIVAFLLAPLYYPYHGIFVSQPQQAPILFGGRHRGRKH